MAVAADPGIEPVVMRFVVSGTETLCPNCLTGPEQSTADDSIGGRYYVCYSFGGPLPAKLQADDQASSKLRGRTCPIEWNEAGNDGILNLGNGTVRGGRGEHGATDDRSAPPARWVCNVGLWVGGASA